jgi:uncharacterized protein (TIGR03437 family)
MHHLFRTLVIAALVCACLLPAALAQPVIGAAVNAASNEALLASGCWMSIYGTNLAPETNQAAAVPLPHSLSGVSVSVNGVSAPLLFVPSGQINALVPFDIQVAGGSRVPADVVVTAPQGTSAPHPVFLTAVAPALYTRDMTGKGPAIVLTPGFQLLDSVAPGDTVVVYAAGLGQTDPPAQSDSGGAATEPYNRVPDSAMPEVWVGDQRAEVLFAGLAPGFPGVYQLNLRLPAVLSRDRVMLRSGLVQSNIAQAPIPSGQNTANVVRHDCRPVPERRLEPEPPGSDPADIFADAASHAILREHGHFAGRSPVHRPGCRRVRNGAHRNRSGPGNLAGGEHGPLRACPQRRFFRPAAHPDSGLRELPDLRRQSRLHAAARQHSASEPHGSGHATRHVHAAGTQLDDGRRSRCLQFIRDAARRRALRHRRSE